MSLYSRISWTAMPIGAPPRQIPTRKVGLKPLRTTCRPSSIESRNSESAEMKILSEGPKDIVVLRAQALLIPIADHTTIILLLFCVFRAPYSGGSRFRPNDSQIAEQVHRELGRLARRDRSEPQVVVVGRFLSDIAAGTHDE